jgi:hypothetical protein
MISYRFRRRAFLTAMSGGVGLKIMLRNMEAAAQTTKSPPRLLVSHWPVGIVAGSSNALWAPTSGSIGGSPGLQPFADAGLGPDMTVIKGISTPVGMGGSHEGGTVALATGVAPAGTRSGEAESDDAYASGPSFDQVLLANLPGLKPPGSAFSYANVACDTRTDFGEISTKCLSYSTMQQYVGAALGPNPGMENIPLMPALSPLTAYNNLFAGFVPTGGPTAAPRAADAMLTNLASRRSVLDFVAQELNVLRQMGPADVRMKLDNHYNAVVSMEHSLTVTIDRDYPKPTGAGGAGGSMGIGGAGGGGGEIAGTGGIGGGQTAGCTTKPAEPPNVVGAPDPTKGVGNSFNNPMAGATDDGANIQAVGAAHFSVLKAAFICDVIRCGTFLWAPGSNHIGLKGLFPNSTSIYMHHPQSHRVTTSNTVASSTLSQLDATAQFLFNAQLWFFTRQAENLKSWKTAVDGFGNSLLDSTVVPFVTEVLATGHERTNMPAMIIGGKALGFSHNIYRTGSFTVNQYWGTIAQALGYPSTTAPFAAPISGLWTSPA